MTAPSRRRAVLDRPAASQQPRAHVRRRQGPVAVSSSRTTVSIGTFSYEVVLNATDSSGLKSTTSIKLPIAPPPPDTTPPAAPAEPDRDRRLGQPGRSGVAGRDRQHRGHRLPAGALHRRRLHDLRRDRHADRSDLSRPRPHRRHHLPLPGPRQRCGGQPRRLLADRRGDHAGARRRRRPGWSPPTRFDEAAGTTAADASGNANTGTLQTGAGWTAAGHAGGALVLRRLERPGARAGLELARPDSSAMTLEAWIRPTVAQGGWRTIMQRETDAYFLNASNDTGALRPSGGGTFGPRPPS